MRGTDGPGPGLRNSLGTAADLLRRAGPGRPQPGQVKQTQGALGPEDHEVRPTSRAIHYGRRLEDLGHAGPHRQPEVQHPVVRTVRGPALGAEWVWVEPAVWERAGVPEGVPPLPVRAARCEDPDKSG